MIKEKYVTEDGKEFDNKVDALRHQERISGINFESIDEFTAYLKATETWKSWEKSIDWDNYEYNYGDVLKLYEDIGNLSNNLSEELPKIFITGRRVYLSGYIWSLYEKDTMIKYFRENTDLTYSDEQIIGLYNKAFSEEHSYGFSGTLNEFDKYIEILEFMRPSE